MLNRLESIIRHHPRLVALTGAGISARSGIPTYRNDCGQWQRSDPIQHQDFIRYAAARRRYWARSMAGWRYIADSSPNAAHHALVTLESAGHIDLLVTQNVDRLHQRAGHQAVVDLHGRLDRVRCLECGASLDRAALQLELEQLNTTYGQHLARALPDGDAEVEDAVVDDFRVPGCSACGGVLMPDVVFFGGSVPRERIERATQSIEACDALLVVGSSLMVFSGFRFCRLAHALGKPVLIVNRGATRADDLATLKLADDCEPALAHLANRLGKASATVL